MGKRESYIVRLKQFFNALEEKEIAAFLTGNSNLPGPRGNLELADAFGEALTQIAPTEAHWDLLGSWSTISALHAPTNDPNEFLPFCAITGYGALYEGAAVERRAEIVRIIKKAANDDRWRIREAVARALQIIGEKDLGELASILEDWIEHASLMEQRAIVASMAHPSLLKNQDFLNYSMEISQITLENILKLDNERRKSEDFRVFKKGLSYALSLFVERLPKEGFGFLHKWSRIQDKDIKQIIVSNLKKNRLMKKHEAEATRLLNSM